MKIIFLLSGFLIFNAETYSQVETAQVGAEFKEVTADRGVDGMHGYSSGTVRGSQFFSPTWTTGTITTIHNEVISKNYSFLYDKVRQEIFIKWKDSSAVLLAQKDQVSAFTLNTDRVHSFVPASVYDPSKKR